MENNKDKKLINHLKNKYNGINFSIIRNEYLIELIHDSKENDENESFLEDVFNECAKYLNEDDLFKLAITYDFINRIPIKEIQYEPIIELQINKSIINRSEVVYSDIKFKKMVKRNLGRHIDDVKEEIKNTVQTYFGIKTMSVKNMFSKETEEYNYAPVASVKLCI